MYPKGQEKLKLVAIKTKDKVYISDNYKNEGYFHSKLNNLIIDGKEPEETYTKYWFKVNDVPSKIEKFKPKTKINQRYELKAGYPESELTPKVVNYSDFDEEYDDVRGLYTYKYDELEEGMEDVEFEINVIEEIDQVFEMKKMDYKPVFNLIDRIQTHPMLLPLRPCKLTHEQSYTIIREFLKNNIDSKYAEMTDYNFCLTVNKKIELYQPKSYVVDLNATFKRRKPKYETQFRNSKNIKIFEIAP